MTRTAPSNTTAVIAPGDARYENAVRCGFNQRFVSDVDYICYPKTTGDVVAAVGDAVAEGKRVTVRSGGHGYEGTASTDGGVLVDVSLMTEVEFDPARRAFSIQPGAKVGALYTELYKRWGVTVPVGECIEVCIGGHLVGGGFGPLSRRYGSIVDFLCAVEVVVVDASGQARAVIATDDPADPDHELWWAHTGGGGGNFGVVTRYWLRTRGAVSDDPAQLLPPAPTTWRNGYLMWPWDKMTEQDFVRILRNYGTWFERNSVPGSREADLTAFFCATHKSSDVITVGSLIDDDIPGARELTNEFFDAVCEGVDVEPSVRHSDDVVSWLYHFTHANRADHNGLGGSRFKLKSAYLRKAYTEDQIARAYRHLDTEDPKKIFFMFIGYGGQVNALPPEATAVAQRSSVLKGAYLSSWWDPAEDDYHIGNLRALYRDVYAETGGVPVTNDANEGAYINYPDRDLADPEWNTSGVPWSTLYYQGNYPRLQQVKQKYDPRNEFRHVLSIELPE
ncbi:FAD-binding oxidoreductase [Kibdelosporangium phytohabitans]|uniref:FAD-linked oxidase n=1 Tax=Kibdelosporangium phytohabitans TaxID=860235 RepID=A0A0N7F488_9PSEU|nr:FAD-binding protein [Kibdelosporangium phytohabitans]ALG10751.1 FAD-linked oxidase [Kibdelosporangium phytohabitans]MBE1461902.1 aclacinomycin oxidase [Kibdelosporangium phytohabitans]